MNKKMADLNFLKTVLHYIRLEILLFCFQAQYDHDFR